MAVRVSEEGTDLSPSINGLSEKLGASRLQSLVRGSAVGYPHRELVTHRVRVAGCGERHGRLARSGSATGHEKEPGALELEDRGRASILSVESGTEHIRVEPPRTVDVRYN